jgi:sulfotransferase family protein
MDVARMRGIRAQSGRLRVLPDFLVIGAEKCGTTSLYQALTSHPDVHPSRRKEPHYFDYHHARGETWYRAWFPYVWVRALRRRRRGRFLTGEASPDYIFHPHAARRAHALLPEARLIAILRDPVERAFSHHQQQVRKGREPLSFEEAIAREPERVDAPLAEMARDDRLTVESVTRFSYLARGRYAEQIERWIAHYPRERLLVLFSEELSKEPAETLRRAFEFLGLDADGVAFDAAPRRNVGGYEAAIEPSLRRRLEDAFAPHDARLRALLGRPPAWRA